MPAVFPAGDPERRRAAEDTERRAGTPQCPQSDRGDRGLGDDRELTRQTHGERLDVALDVNE